MFHCLLSIIVIVGAAQGVPKAPQQSPSVVVSSALDGKVITNTDYLEDPGPYNVYATIAEKDVHGPKQRWSMYGYDGSNVVSFNANSGQFLNSFSIYKPCPNCYAATEYWNLMKVEFGGGNNTFILNSTWTELCLINPGIGYLSKGPCDFNDVRQIWKITNIH